MLHPMESELAFLILIRMVQRELLACCEVIIASRTELFLIEQGGFVTGFWHKAFSPINIGQEICSDH